MNPFEYTSALQYKVKSLAQQIAEFKSGERYRKLEQEYKSIIRKSLQSSKKRIWKLFAREMKH